MKNPFSKSRKFYELIDIYKEIALKGCYYENGDFCPPERVFGKSGQLKFKEVLKKIFDKNKIKTVLDYGGGQGSWVLLDDKGVKLQDYLKLEKVTIFEPARDLNEKPKAECVVSFDVLEHVFFADVPWVLYDIFSKAEKVVIINVASFKASKKITNSENAHITQRPPFWWKGMIDCVANYFPNINYSLLVSTEPRKVTIYEPVSINEQLNISGYTCLNK